MASPVADEATYRRLSEVLRQILPNEDGGVPVRRIVEALGERSFATLLMVFAALNLLPLPIGSTLVLGIPLMIIAWQMVLRRERVWLPRIILDRQLSSRAWIFLITRIVPRIERLERIIRPRSWPLDHKHGDRIIGVFLLILGTAVFLPIPLGNWLPAIACFIIALGVSERDGITLGIGVVIGIVSLGIIAGVVVLGDRAFDWLIAKIDLRIF